MEPIELTPEEHAAAREAVLELRVKCVGHPPPTAISTVNAVVNAVNRLRSGEAEVEELAQDICDVVYCGWAWNEAADGRMRDMWRDQARKLINAGWRKTEDNK